MCIRDRDTSYSRTGAHARVLCSSIVHFHFPNHETRFSCIIFVIHVLFIAVLPVVFFPLHHTTGRRPSLFLTSGVHLKTFCGLLFSGIRLRCLISFLYIVCGCRFYSHVLLLHFLCGPTFLVTASSVITRICPL